MAAVGAGSQAPRLATEARPSALRRGDDRRTAWLVFACVLAAAFIFLVWKGRGNTFVYDEWGWIEYRRNGLHSILASYNEHLLAVPLAVYQLLFHTIGLGHYTIYRLLVAVGHLSCAAVVFEFARRRIGLAALLLGVPIAFLGSGWEYELQGVNFGFTASIASGIGALLALDRDDRRGDAVACGLLVLGLAFSEFSALFALGIAVAMLVFDRGPRRAWVWAVPLGLYGVWWLAYYEPVTTGHDLIKVPKFAADMAASAAGGLFGAGLQRGRLILLAVIALVGWRLVRRRALSPPLLALLVTVIAFWLLVAFGRAHLVRPWEPHYIYTGAVLIVLILAESLRGTRLTQRTLPLAGGIALLALVGNIRAFDGGETYLRTASTAVSAELGALQLARTVAPPGLVLDQHWAPQIQAGPYFAAVAALGSPRADSPAQLIHEPEYARIAADGLLLRAGEVQTEPAAGSAASAGHSPVVHGSVAGSWSSRRSCVEFHAQKPDVALAVLLPATGLEVQSAVGRPTRVRTRRFATGFETAPIATSTGGGTIVIQPTSDRATVPWHAQISAAGSVRVCTGVR